MEVGGGGGNVVMTRLEDLEPQLACVTKLLIGLSCSMEGSCSQAIVFKVHVRQSGRMTFPILETLE